MNDTQIDQADFLGTPA